VNEEAQATLSSYEYAEVRSALRRQVIRRVMKASAIVGALALLFGIYTALVEDRSFVIPIYSAAFIVLLLAAFHPRFSFTHKAFTLVVLLYLLGLLDLFVFGWGADGRVFFIGFLMITIILFGRREGLIALGVGFTTLVLVALAMHGGWVSAPGARVWTPPTLVGLLSNAAMFLLIGSLVLVSQDEILSLLARELREVFEKSEALAEERRALDEQATALQEANYAMQRRAWHLRAGAEVAHEITSIFDVEQLLYRAVRLISEKFGFYHAGLFLVEENGQVAVLKAASSEGGQQMLAAGHRLRRGEGMVGWVLEHAEPRIALDVGEDAVYFDNPRLPATRSEAALPLILDDRVLGVLDVQSIEENAFDADDIRSLEYLANQLAVALENARRLELETGVLEATNPFYRMARQVAAAREMHDVYAVLLEMIGEYHPTQAFIFEPRPERDEMQVVAQLLGDRVRFPESEDGALAETLHLRPLLAELEGPLFVEDVRDEEALPEAYHSALTRLREHSAVRSLAVLPVRLGSRLLVHIVVFFTAIHVFSVTEKQFYAALADTGAVVMENIRLLESTQRRVAREQAIRDITDRMRQAPDIEWLMRITAESLVQTLGGEGAYVHLGLPTAAPETFLQHEETE